MKESLQQWLIEQLDSLALPRPEHLSATPVTGDAGFRCYFRLNTEMALLAVDAPPVTENNPAFITVADLLCESGVHAPKIYASDVDKGYLLIEDLGDQLYLPLLSAVSAEGLYSEAMEALLKLQLTPQSSALPCYDQTKLMSEMALLTEWFVPQLLNVDLSEDDLQILQETFTRLASSALEQPQVLVHRDYHSRNLLHCENGGTPGVIDFQDAVWGAITYDLVSLLRDCYISWPELDVRRWALQFKGRAEAEGLLPRCENEQFIRWFDWMGLQRHIKVLGIFARLSLRDGKTAYLQDLPLVLEYTLSVARRYPEFSEFIRLFETKILPAAKKQSWWRECSL